MAEWMTVKYYKEQCGDAKSPFNEKPRPLVRENETIHGHGRSWTVSYDVPPERQKWQSDGDVAAWAIINLTKEWAFFHPKELVCVNR